MKNMHPIRFVLIVFFIHLLFGFLTQSLVRAANNKITVLEETADGKVIAIPTIGIKRGLLPTNEDGLIIIEVDKQGPLRWMMRDTKLMSVTWNRQEIPMNEWAIPALDFITKHQEIFVHFLRPGDIDEKKIETRNVDILFSIYLTPNYTDYSSK
ncbi:MAG: hypothetical protein HYT28_01630 [Parcubacteria group bacterium]|nr:hypothetical protein [Parcubacteria group bacterium]